MYVLSMPKGLDSVNAKVMCMRLTLVAVGAGEALVAGAGEVAPRLAVALAVGPAHVGRNVAHAPLFRAVARHSDGAAVNH